MTYLHELLDDLRHCLTLAVSEYRNRRWLRGGWRNPDEAPF